MVKEVLVREFRTDRTLTEPKPFKGTIKWDLIRTVIKDYDVCLMLRLDAGMGELCMSKI